MSRTSPVRDPEQIAAICRRAHAVGRPMSAAVADAYGISRRAASAAISRARTAGHDIPTETNPAGTKSGAQYVDTEDSAVRIGSAAIGVHTITRAEYMARMAQATAPLTDGGMVRPHQTQTMRLMRGGGI